MSRQYRDVQSDLIPAMRDVESVGNVLENAAAEWGEDHYMTYAPTGESFTFHEMNDRANRVANALGSLGVGKGDRVGLYLTNSPTFVVCIYASAKLGAIATPINWMYREREVRHAIETAEIETVVVESDDDVIDTLASVTPDVAHLERIVMTDEHRYEEIAATPGIETYLLDNLERDVDDAAPDVDVGWEDPAAILYTSGTTGLPKPTVLANRSYLYAAKGWLGVPFGDDDVNYNPFPLFHANNQLYSMLASAIDGSSYVLSDTFSIERFWGEVTENDVTSINIIGGVPKMLDSQFDEDEIPDNDIELAVGPISTELWESFEEKFDLTVIQGYSQTEAPTPLFSHPDPDAVKVGAIGQPMFPDEGHEAWIEDENGVRLDPGNEGELVRTDPGAMIEYWKMPEKTEETLRDGKIYSGDIVRMDDDGYVYYVDRKKFMVRRGGENVSAQQVENVIDELSGVSESAIVPVPDEFYGEEIKAMVMRRTDAVDERDVVLQVAENLAPYKVPRYVEFVEEFPRTPTERIQRTELAAEEKERTDHGWDREERFPDWKEQSR